VVIKIEETPYHPQWMFTVTRTMHACHNVPTFQESEVWNIAPCLNFRQCNDQPLIFGFWDQWAFFKSLKLKSKLQHELLWCALLAYTLFNFPYVA
jgi:hypothetical protein